MVPMAAGSRPRRARGPYTRLMLVRIDADGNDSPAIIVDDTTAANRAINIPEFVNLPPGATIDKIDPQATDFYRLFDEAYTQIQNNQLSKLSPLCAIAANPDDYLHYVLATALSANDQRTRSSTSPST